MPKEEREISKLFDNLKFHLFKGVLQLFAWLPLSVIHKTAGILGVILDAIPNSVRHVTECNLRHCFPTLEEEDLLKLRRESLQQTLCTGLEMGKAWLVDIEHTLSTVKESQGQQELEEVLSEGKGVILLAPHIGNWEIFGFHITRQTPSTFLYQPPRTDAMDKLLKRARDRSGAALAPTNRKGVSMLVSALHRGELIGVLPDQVPNRGEGAVLAPFFNASASTMTLVSKLAHKNKDQVRVFCGFAMRLPKGRGFKVVIEPVDAEIYDRDLETSTKALNRGVESCVKKACSQYQWEYKRFKKLPQSKKIYAK